MSLSELYIAKSSDEHRKHRISIAYSLSIPMVGGQLWYIEIMHEL